MYPEYAEIDGKEYKIDTSYRTALECLEISENEDISDIERIYAIVYKLFGFIPDELDKFMDKAVLYLQCGQTTEEQKSKKRDMDMIQDKAYIMSSFMSDYHIDLNTTDLHFWQFVELITGLTENCSLNRVRNLRNYDLSEEKDVKRRKEIQEAQKQVALKKKEKKPTNEQIKAQEEYFKLFNKLGGE